MFAIKILIRTVSNKEFLQSKYMATTRVKMSITSDDLEAIFNFVNRHLTIMESATLKYSEHDFGERIELPPQIQKPLNQYLSKFLPAIQEVTTQLIGELCPICYQCYLPQENYRKLKCNHTYHASCIDKWMGGNLDELSCPLCRESQYECKKIERFNAENERR